MSFPPTTTASESPLDLDHPWGEAIRFWLRDKGISQAELATATGISKNAIGRIVRGLHAQTRLLELIALHLQVPFESILVSPRRHGRVEDRRAFARQMIEDALRVLDVTDTLDDATIDLAKRLAHLSTDARRTVLRLVVQYEKRTPVSDEKPSTRKPRRRVHGR